MTTILRPEDERPARMARDFAKVLTRRYRWKLYGATVALSAGGFLHGLLASSPTAFPRYGAIIALVTFWHAFAQQKYLAMLQHEVEPFGRSFGAQIGKNPDRTSAHLERLRTSVQERFSADYLVCGTIGVIVWGFGDLLLFAVLPH